ncbi:unnamed protein product, partial [Mesorhabditis spiculigera]
MGSRPPLGQYIARNVEAPQKYRLRVKTADSRLLDDFAREGRRLYHTGILSRSGLDRVLKCTALERKSTKADSFLYYHWEYSGPKERWGEDLLAFIRCWLRAVQQRGLQFYDVMDPTPVWTIPPESLTTSLSCLDDFPVHSTLFGSLPCRRTFNAHWEIAFAPHSEEGERAEYTASFIHDEGVVLVTYRDIDWHQTEKNRRSNRNHRDTYGRRGSSRHHNGHNSHHHGRNHNNNREAPPVVSKYSLKLYYKHVSRIIVDLVGKRDGDSYVTLYFVSVVPVELRRHAPGRQQDIRVTSVFRGRRSQEEPPNGLIADCNVMAVRFHPNHMSDTQLYSLLARISERNPITEIQVASTMINFQIMVHERSRRNAANRQYEQRQVAWSSRGSGRHPYGYSAPTPNYQLYSYYQYDHDEQWTRLLKQRPPKPSFFPIAYLIEALFRRGCVVKDQFLGSCEQFRIFLDTIKHEWERDAERCEWALEDVLGRVSEADEAIPILRNFRRTVEKPMDVSCRSRRRELEAGYVRCRKLIVTPTRLLPLPAETLMGCRVLRSEDSQMALRIAFREDDGTRMFRGQTSEYLMKQRVKDTLIRGIKLCGRDYQWLGSSNSQYREHGAFFVASDGRDVLEIRKKFGDFTSIESDQKAMSRFGQCFTQSKGVEISIQEWDYETVPDYIGGNDSNNAPYIFSDGVGTISMAVVSRIVEQLRLPSDFSPSAFQFRFRGLKGMVTKHPVLDYNNDFLERLQIGDRHRLESPPPPGYLHYTDFQFRPSQTKFVAPHASEIEVVKLAAPSLATLNRPFLAIIDQVSSMQSSTCHMRTRDRVEELLDKHVEETLRVLVDEEAARERIRAMPARIEVDRLKLSHGFQLTAEPFFRMILKSTVKHTFCRELQKMQIRLPAHKARMMFGVIDETGLLQYGQLRHLVDVIVFPRWGPRPHSDEMAGSDLDGDEYVVIWDDQLLFDYNMPPSDYTGLAPGLPVVTSHTQHSEDEEEESPIVELDPRRRQDDDDEEDLIDVAEYEELADLSAGDVCKEEYKPRRIVELTITPPRTPASKPIISKEERTVNEVIQAEAECYANYMLNDTLGTIAIAHLSNADRWGLLHPVCETVARLHSRAVDFPKSGQAPERLSKKWGKADDPDTGLEVEVPPTKPLFAPDFLDKDHEPMYKSGRLTGYLWRKVDNLIEMVNKTDTEEQKSNEDFLARLEIKGWETYQPEARLNYDYYIEEQQHLMGQFGVATEAELFTGAYLDFRGKNAQREKDERSAFTVAAAVDQKMHDIWGHFREGFCKNIQGPPFGKYEELTEPSERLGATGPDDMAHRYFATATQEMKKKAVAYYHVVYDRYKDERDLRDNHLSFAWLMWDILALVMKDNFMREAQNQNTAHRTLVYPIEQLLLDEMYKIPPHYELRCMRSPRVPKYLRVYPEILPILKLVEKWAITKNLLKTPMRAEHLAFLFLSWATGTPRGAQPPAKLDRLTDAELEDPRAQRRVIEALLINPGRYLLRFLEWLGSGAFRHLHMLDFPLWLGLDCIFSDGEWAKLSEAARELNLEMSLSGQPSVMLEHETMDARYKDPVKTKLFTINVPNVKRSEYKVHGRVLTDDNESVELLCGRMMEAYNLLECKMRIRQNDDLTGCLNVRVFVRGKASCLLALHKARLLVFPMDPEEIEDHREEDDTSVMREMIRRLIIRAPKQ